MRYLVIMPDYTGSCIRDEFEGEIELEKLHLPQDLIDAFSLWHDKYRKIIPLDQEDREKIVSEIENLDREGLELAKKLQSSFSGEVKVKYFSEGKMRYL